MNVNRGMLVGNNVYLSSGLEIKMDKVNLGIAYHNNIRHMEPVYIFLAIKWI